MLPKGRDAALEMYIKKVRMDVELQSTKWQAPRSRNNLSSEERASLRDLHGGENLIIKPADKGSAVAALSKEDYVKEAD